MESKNELEEIDIKNHMYYYFDDIIRDIDINFSYNLLEEKSYKTYENVLICDISYKTFMGSIPLRIKFDKIDGFIKNYNGIRYLILLDYGWCGKICDRIKYLINEKVVLQIVLIIILEESELIRIILDL